jgi:hypothetical protein
MININDVYCLSDYYSDHLYIVKGVNTDSGVVALTRKDASTMHVRKTVDYMLQKAVYVGHVEYVFFGLIRLFHKVK